MAMPASCPVLEFVDDQSDSIVTDLAYDYHGRRLASVSADGVIRIRDLDDNGVWCVEEGCEIKLAHQVMRTPRRPVVRTNTLDFTAPKRVVVVALGEFESGYILTKTIIHTTHYFFPHTWAIGTCACFPADGIGPAPTPTPPPSGTG